MPASHPHALVIGAGHNGLVTAFLLARAGLKVRVVERRGVVGGAAVTEAFHPGFRNSTCSYTVSLLAPEVIGAMDLHAHGLRIVERPVSNFLPLDGARHLILGPTLADTQASVAQFSAKDAAALPDYYARLDRVADVLRSLSRSAPPADLTPAAIPAALRAGRLARGLSEEARLDALHLFTRSARDVLDQHFESDPIKAAFGFDSVVGNYASPDHPGSAYVLLHHVFGEVNGKKGAWGHAVGGMGAITQAMARACEAAGVEITCGTAVERVEVENGRIAGVTLADGSLLRAPLVAANCHPRLLFERLLPPAAAPAPTRAAALAHRSGSATLRINVALSALPRFTALPDPGPHLTGGIIMAPSLAYMDRAYTDARAHGWSSEPIVEMLVPSTIDDSLAPPGAHVASLFCQHFAPALPDGRSWDDAKAQAVDTVFATVERFAPGFRALILGHQALTPLDLEREFGLVGGDIFHGRMSLDQLWAARPWPGMAAYRTPIRGLYLCGAGAHPGGGVSGLPGMNAARAILADRSRLPWRRWAA